MHFLPLLFFGVVSLVSVSNADPEFWIFKDDSNLVKTELTKKGEFTHALAIDWSTDPATLAVYIEGNGVKHEIRREIQGLKTDDPIFANHPDILVFTLKSRNLAILCKKDDYGKLIVIENNKCTAITFDKKDQTRVTGKYAVPEVKCEEMQKEVENKVQDKGQRQLFMFKRKETDNLIKSKLETGKAFKFGVVVDWAPKTPVLGFYVEGHGIEDEVQVELDSLEEEEKETRLVNNIHVLKHDMDRIIVRLLSHEFMFIIRTYELAMIVVNKNVCKRREYDILHPAEPPTEDDGDDETCTEAIQEILAASPVPPDLWIYKFPGGQYTNWRLYNGKTFKDGIAFDKKNKKIGIYIAGENMEDEFHVIVRSEIQAMKVEISNTPEKYIARLPFQHLTLIGKQTSPDMMILIVERHCVRRLYKRIRENDPYVFSEFHFDDDECQEIMDREGISTESMNEDQYIQVEGQPETLCYKEEDDNLKRLHYYIGNIFRSCLVLDTNSSPHNLGIFIKGNGVEDELLLQVNSEEDVNGLKFDYKPNENNQKKITFGFPKYKYGIVSDVDQPGVIIEVKESGCVKRTYDKDNPRQKTEEESYDAVECDKLRIDLGLPQKRKPEESQGKPEPVSPRPSRKVKRGPSRRYTENPVTY